MGEGRKRIQKKQSEKTDERERKKMWVKKGEGKYNYKEKKN